MPLFSFSTRIMENIYLNEAIPLSIVIPQSSSGDTVTYEIIKVSDGSVVQSGSMTFVRDEIWRVSYTPAALGVFALKVNNTTISSKRENFYRVVAASTVVTTGSDTVPTTQAMLDNVRIALNAKLTGGAVQSYTISGRSVQNYSLKELMELEASLIKRLQAEAGTGGRNFAKFTNR